MTIANMLISTEVGRGCPGLVTCVAKLGDFEFKQHFSKAIAFERIQTYFEIQAGLMYEKFQEDQQRADN